MDLTPHVSALRDDLAAAAAVGDEATSRAGSALAAALEPAMRLALMNALSELATEIDGALDDRTVSLRLRGREVDVVVDGANGRDRPGPDEDPAPAGFFAGPSSSPFAAPGPERAGHGPFPPPGPGHHGGFGGEGFGGSWDRGGPDVGDISRMTLRIVDQIKGQAERAAAAQGMSLNSWVSQAVQGALRGQGGWPGGRHGGTRGRSGADGADGTDGVPGTDGAPGAPGRDGTSGRDRSPDAREERTDRRGTEGDGDGGVRGWVQG